MHLDCIAGFGGFGAVVVSAALLALLLLDDLERQQLLTVAFVVPSLIVNIICITGVVAVVATVLVVL